MEGREEDDWQLQLALFQSEQERKRRRLRQQDEEHDMEAAVTNSMQAERDRQLRVHDSELATDLQVTQVLDQLDRDERQNALAVVMAKERSTVQEPGDWHCPHCTFRNRGFQPTCRLCTAKAPRHVLSFRRIPEAYTFGVELELLVTNGKVDGFDCHWLAKQLSNNNNGGGLPCEFRGYPHETTPYWKIVTDASLQSDARDLALELVSPVLHGEEGLVQVRMALKGLRNLGIEKNSSCGFHVHVGTREPDSPASLTHLPRLQKLVWCFVTFEEAFDAITSRQTSHTIRQTNQNRFCQSNLLQFGSKSPRQISTLIKETTSVRQLVKLLCPERYMKLNLTNVVNSTRPSTIEFRQHGGVDDLLSAEAWVRLVLLFCDAAASNGWNMSLLQQQQGWSRAERLRKLFDLVGCPGLESFYAMERRLFQVSETSTNWKCPVCRREFRKSQDLANHARATGHRRNS